MTIETLNSEAPATSTAATMVEPSLAPAPAEKPSLPVNSVDSASRCHYRYPNGRRCALAGLAAKSGLCLRHYNRRVAAGLPLVPTHDDSTDLSTDLLPETTDFLYGEDVQKFLARLLAQVAKGRVSPRRAAVLAYITNQLLHSHRAIDKESEDEPKPFIFDLPRPKRD